MSSTSQPTTFSECAVDTCARTDLEAGGLCNRHYAYNLRHGHPEVTRPADVTLALTATESAWFAAVIDCEGTIGISRTGQRYFTFVSAGNTNPLLIERIAKLAGGGRIRFVPRPGRAKDLYEWKASKAETVRSILNAIRGDLLLKREQARLILEEWPVLHAKEAGRRAVVHAQVAALNRKGKP